ncbi:MAG: hypothetical protein ACK5P7_02905 [Bdellovibrio sp.]|jgi:hypothetical protein
MTGAIINNKHVLLTLLSVAFLCACAPQKFENLDGDSIVDLPDPLNNDVSSNFFKLSDSSTVFEQSNLDENRTSTSFQVQLADGTYVNDLRRSDLNLTENGITVNDFVLSSNSQSIVQTVDIVFAVDVTGSMTPTIESAKTRLINFVNSTRARGYHTRMCLVTFGDYTVQKCNKFYDNNPADPATETQVQELISEITKLRALKGAEDPGGSDFNENPMRAVIDSAAAPWGETSQRFMILITDDGFLYSPGNAGSVGNLAPRWNEVLAAVQTSQMKIFAATPSLAGYDKKFSGQAGLVEASGGEFFLFNNLINGSITLDTILNRIISRVKTTYLAQYTADTVPGLDPTLELSKREIKVTLRSGLTATIVSQTKQSNIPSGRPEYIKSWKLSDKAILPGSLRVKVNGNEIDEGYSVVAGSLVFLVPPVKGAKIDVSFQYASLKDALQFSPIVLNAKEDLNALSILINGVKAKGPDIVFERTLEGQWTIRPSERVLSEADSFQIRKNGGLLIKVMKVKTP